MITFLKTASFKMRIALVASVIWFLFFFIRGMAEGSRDCAIFFMLAVLPLIFFWGIWWIAIGYIKNRKFVEDKKVEIPPDRNQNETEATSLASNPISAFISRSWILIAALIALLIIGFIAYTKEMTLVESCLISIEWFLQSLTLAVCLSALLSWIKKKTFKYFLPGAAAFSLLIAAIGIYSQELSKAELSLVTLSPVEQNALWEIKLGFSKEEVQQKKGMPLEIEKDGIDDIWEYKRNSHIHRVRFRNGVVCAVQYFGSKNLKYSTAKTIALGDSQTKVEGIFGRTHEVISSQSMKPIKIFIYPQYNVFVTLENEIVVGMTVFKNCKPRSLN